ncbi:hypothetical protein AB5I41_23890 [Sphingomonas sp. MMS24-JH45]
MATPHRRGLRLSRRPDGVRHRRDPGQVRRQRGHGAGQRHLYAEGRQRGRHVYSSIWDAAGTDQIVYEVRAIR